MPASSTEHERDALTTELDNCLTSMLNRVRMGFHNGLDGLASQPTPWIGTDEPSPVVAEKLAPLEVLHRAGVLDEGAFGRQRRLLLALALQIGEHRTSNEEPTQDLDRAGDRSLAIVGRQFRRAWQPA